MCIFIFNWTHLRNIATIFGFECIRHILGDCVIPFLVQFNPIHPRNQHFLSFGRNML